MEYIYEAKPIVDRCTHQPKIVFVYVSFVFLISHFLIRIPSSVLYFVISNGRYENKKKNMNSHAFSIYSLTRDMRRVGMRRVVCVCQSRLDGQQENYSDCIAFPNVGCKICGSSYVHCCACISLKHTECMPHRTHTHIKIKKEKDNCCV